jgi:hypothetical protein
VADQPIEKKIGTRSGMNELGRTGLKHFGGTLYEEFLPQLKGTRGQKVYKEMSENSPIIGAMLFAVESLLRSVDWNVEPVSESDEDIEAAEFLESCMSDMSHTWEDFISEILSMLIYGWSYFEIVYKRRRGPKKSPNSEEDDGRIGWRKFSLRSQDTLYRWEIDEFGGIQGMWQYPVPSTPSATRGHDVILIPIDKSLLFRTTAIKNSPEGRSILRSSYRPWYFSKRIEEIEAIGLERDLAGIPIAKVPIEYLATEKSGELAATYNYIKDVVTKTKRDQQEGIIFPKVIDPDTGEDMFSFELLSSGGRRSFDTGTIIQRYMQQQAMTIMADFILLGHENVGSFALSSDKTELFAVALGAWLDGIQEILNRHAVPRLFELNSFNVEEYPELRHGDIEKPDIQQVGAYIQQLAGAGMPLFPDLNLENRLREYGDLPEADPEERDRLMAQQSVASFFGGGGESEEAAPSGTSPPPGSGPPGAPPQQQGGEQPVTKGVQLRPRYYDGSKWKTLRGRHRFLKDLRDEAMSND